MKMKVGEKKKFFVLGKWYLKGLEVARECANPWGVLQGLKGQYFESRKLIQSLPCTLLSTVKVR